MDKALVPESHPYKREELIDLY
jgi:hypothetical protein